MRGRHFTRQQANSPLLYRASLFQPKVEAADVKRVTYQNLIKHCSPQNSMTILPILEVIAVLFITIIPTIISVITHAPAINTRSSIASMLLTTATGNRWQSAVDKANIVHSDVSKHIVASLCLKNDLERCRTSANIKFALKPIIAYEVEKIRMSTLVKAMWKCDSFPNVTRRNMRVLRKYFGRIFR